VRRPIYIHYNSQEWMPLHGHYNDLASRLLIKMDCVRRLYIATIMVYDRGHYIAMKMDSYRGLYLAIIIALDRGFYMAITVVCDGNPFVAIITVSE
jgi:hypothetical protein